MPGRFDRFCSFVTSAGGVRNPSRPFTCVPVDCMGKVVCPCAFVPCDVLVSARKSSLPMTRAAAVAAAFLISASASAAGPTSSVFPPVEVIVKTVEQPAIRGQVVSLSSSAGLVILTDGQEQRLRASDLVRITNATVGFNASSHSLTQRVPLAKPFSRDPHILTFALAGGDVLHGQIVGDGDDGVVIETVDLGRIRIPLESVARIDTLRGELPAYRPSVQWLDHTPGDDEDRILLTNGDVVRGFVTSIDKEGVTVDADMGETKVPHRLIVAVRLARVPLVCDRSEGPALLWGCPAETAGQQPAASHPPYFIVTIGDSGRVTMTAFDWSAGVVEARLPQGAPVKFDPRRVVNIEVVGGRWEWVSSHHPISYQHTPMLSLHWEYATDRNVLDGPIRVAGERFTRGVGVHSRSSITYDLKGAYREFVTSFGIDDDSGPYADVTAHNLVAGQPRFVQTNVRRGRLFGPVRLDVSGAKRIELITDFGDNGDLQDRFDWIEAALIRK